MIVSNRFVSRLLAVVAGALALLALPEMAAAQDASAKLEVSFNVPLKCFIQGGELIFNRPARRST